MPQLPRIGRPFGKVGFGCLQIKNVDSGPIDYGTPGYPVSVYPPHGSYRPPS